LLDQFWDLAEAEPSWPDKPPDGPAQYRCVAGDIATKFTSVDHAIEFNMGAWFLNAMRLQVLAYHGAIVVGELTDKGFHNVAGVLDAEKVAAALTSEISLTQMIHRPDE
jgi:hypothetical protein